jgi:HlyD family secretion protein
LATSISSAPSAVESKQQELTSAQAAVDASEANLQSARQEVVRLKADQEGFAAATE